MSGRFELENQNVSLFSMIRHSQKTAYARRNGRFAIHATLGGTLYITGLRHKNVRSVSGVLQSSLTEDDWGRVYACEVK